MKRQRTEHEIELVTEMVANIGSYVPSTVEGLQDKLADAQAAMNATTQEEIDAATATLREARLNARTKADVSALEELIAYAAALDMRGFTAQSAAEVIQAIEQGRLIARDPEATQEDVDIQLQHCKVRSMACVRQKKLMDLRIPRQPHKAGQWQHCCWQQAAEHGLHAKNKMTDPYDRAELIELCLFNLLILYYNSACN